jgi:hypothetical protein
VLKNNGFHNRKRLYFSPITLFANGEQGAWYDPSDITTLFQDSAGTTPVTAVGQPVGLLLDKSGRGNHAFQATDAKRPLWQNSGGLFYLAFNGSTSALATNSINFTSTDKMTVVTGARKLSDTTYGAIVDLSASPNSLNGTFAVGSATLTGDASRRTWASTLRGNITNNAGVGVFSAPDTKVFLTLYDIGQANAAQEQMVRLNSVLQTLTFGAANSGTGNFGNYPLYIGSRDNTSLPFSGNVYSLIVRGAQSSDYQIAATENYVNGKTGAF